MITNIKIDMLEKVRFHREVKLDLVVDLEIKKILLMHMTEYTAEENMWGLYFAAKFSPKEGLKQTVFNFVDALFGLDSTDRIKLKLKMLKWLGIKKD